MLRIREMERPSRIYPSLLIALVVIPSRPFSLSFLFPFPPLKVVPDAESQSSSPIKTDSFFVFLRKTPQVPYILGDYSDNHKRKLHSNIISNR